MAGGGFDLTTFSRLYGGWFQTAPWLRHGAATWDVVLPGYTWRNSRAVESPRVARGVV